MVIVMLVAVSCMNFLLILIKNLNHDTTNIPILLISYFSDCVQVVVLFSTHQTNIIVMRRFSGPGGCIITLYPTCK